MYNDYEGRKKTNEKTRRMIIEHYIDLYNKLGMQSIPEIAGELEIGEATLRLYLDKMYEEKNCYGKYSKLSLIILLCTKLTSSSPYYKDQQKLKPIIKRRQIAKIGKDHLEKQKQKVK